MKDIDTTNKIKTESILVSVTYDAEDKVNLMVVGKKKRGEAVDIINAFQGEDAARLYNDLITKRVREHAEQNT
jgi:hypothetical protein